MCAACKMPSWSGGAGLATAHLTSRAREWEPLVPGKRERRGRHPRPPERRRAPPKQPGALGGLRPLPLLECASTRVTPGLRRAKRELAGSGSVLGAGGCQWHGEAEVGVRRSSEDSTRGGQGPGGSQTRRAGAGSRAGRQETARGERAPSHRGRPASSPVVSTLRGLFASSITTQPLCPRTQPPTAPPVPRIAAPGCAPDRSQRGAPARRGPCCPRPPPRSGRRVRLLFCPPGRGLRG